MIISWIFFDVATEHPNATSLIIREAKTNHVYPTKTYCTLSNNLFFAPYMLFVVVVGQIIFGQIIPRQELTLSGVIDIIAIFSHGETAVAQLWT